MVDELVKLFEDYKEDGGYNYCPNEWELPEGVEFVDKESQGARRWTETIMVIVEYKGELFAVEYEAGLTENQEDEFYPDKSTIYPVEKQEKVVYTYKRLS